MGTFSIGEAIRFGWSAMKSHFGFFAIVLLIATGIQVVPTILQKISGDFPPVWVSILFVILSIVLTVVKVIMDLGFIKIALKVHDNQIVQISDLFGSRGCFWRYVGSFLLYYFVILAGLLLFIIPGIIFALRLQYFSYLIIDKGSGPVEALRQSWSMTKGHTWHLLGLGLVFFLINLGGALLLLVGLFLTVPTTMVAMAFVYRRLSGGTIPEGTLSKGRIFTLAVLGGVLLILVPALVILIINPMELTRKARDAARLSDFANIQGSINQAQLAGRPLCGTEVSYCEGRSDKGTNSVNGTGWVKVDLVGALSVLPVDPVNNSNYYYRYCSNGSEWEMEMRPESEAMAAITIKDGGNNNAFYEVGSNLTVCSSNTPVPLLGQ